MLQKGKVVSVLKFSKFFWFILIHVLFRHTNVGRRKLMSTSSCNESVWVESHIRNDNHAFVVNTPSGMSTALLSYRTINFEELYIKLRNWNLYWFATNARRKKGINSMPLQAQTDFLPTLRFKTTHIPLFEILHFSYSTPAHNSALSHNLWTYNILTLSYPATASPSRFTLILAR